MLFWKFRGWKSSPGRARTSDTRINSPLLCRLSYRGIFFVGNRTLLASLRFFKPNSHELHHPTPYSASRYSYSYSYSKRPSIAIRPIGPQVPANRLDQRLAPSQLQQPSSTSTVSLSTSTSTTKSDSMHEPRNNSSSTTIESLKPAGWISPAYPGACVWAGSVRSLGSAPPSSLGARIFVGTKKSCHESLGRCD